MTNKNSSFKDGVIDCIPTLFGYIGIGIATGIISKASNLSILEITLSAMIVYVGSAQFIIASSIMTKTQIEAIILTVFLMNLRHFLMSMVIAPHFKNNSLLNNIGIGSLVTDETFAVAVRDINNKKPIHKQWMHGLNITAYFFWIASCFTGAIFGKFLPDPNKFGIDYALIAMFIGLLYLNFISERNKTKLNMMIIILIVSILMIFLMKFLSPEVSLIISTILGCFLGILTENINRK